ncbi:MAG TPA: SDR family NAD(P)-dependent oxidoreductase, partial [Terracidiphilus sp.]
MRMSLFDLHGRVAVVVGGTTGLGHAITIGLAEAGADVVATARRAELVEKVAAEIEALGRRTLRVTSDVADRGSLEKLRDAVLGAFGKVDILVNAQGVTHKVPTLEETEEKWAWVLNT